MIYNVPEVGEIELDTIVFDLNGTLSVNGEIVLGVRDRLERLSQMGYQLYLLSGDQRGTAKEMCEDLGMKFSKATNAGEKADFVKRLDSDNVVSIGNGRIDIGMFQHSKVSIGTLQSEGIHTGIVKHCDIIVPSINDALDLLIHPDSFCGTMRI